MKSAAFTISLLFACLVWGSAAFSQSVNCAPREEIATALLDRFSESQIAIALSADNRLIELFASSNSGSWTLTATDSQGNTCILLFGEAFEQNMITNITSMTAISALSR